MSVDLLQKARQNRIIALETLKRRRDNIFLLEDARADRARRGSSAIFIRRHATNAPARIAAPARTHKIAA